MELLKLYSKDGSGNIEVELLFSNTAVNYQVTQSEVMLINKIKCSKNIFI